VAALFALPCRSIESNHVDREEPIVFAIDDDASMREALSRLFRSIGMRATMFSSSVWLFASIRFDSRLFFFQLFTGRKTRRPIELLAFGMGSYQGVGTQLEEVAAVFESEFSNYPFQPF